MAHISNAEADLRANALLQAVNASHGGENDEAVVKRAEAFYEFLSGKEKE
jgi:hypothetical protein